MRKNKVQSKSKLLHDIGNRINALSFLAKELKDKNISSPEKEVRISDMIKYIDKLNEDWENYRKEELK